MPLEEVALGEATIEAGCTHLQMGKHRVPEAARSSEHGVTKMNEHGVQSGVSKITWQDEHGVHGRMSTEYMAG